MPHSIKAAGSVLMPQFRFMGFFALSGMLMAVALSLFLTFAPLGAGDPAPPDWVWLLFGFVIVAVILSVNVLRYTPLKASAEQHVGTEGGTIVLLAAATISRSLGRKNLIAQLDHPANGGWLWVGEDGLKIWIRDTGEPRVVTRGDIRDLAEVHVMGGFMTDPHLVVWFSDGSVLEAIPTRYGVRSMFPYGRRRMRALVAQIDALASSNPPVTSTD